MATGVSGAMPAAHEGAGDLAEVRHGHVEDDGLAGARHRFPFARRMLVDGAVAGGEDDGVVGLARRCRDAGQRRAGKARGEAGHDAEADAGARQRERLFAAAAEDERIAALEAQHRACSRAPARSAAR